METKLCNQCNQTKPITDYYSDRTRTRTICKKCYKERERNKYHTDADYRKQSLEKAKEYSKNWRKEHTLRILSILKKTGCKDCGETNPVVLDFDHVKDTKTLGISKMVRNHWSWDKIEFEISKCEVRCSNCHRKKTAKDRGYYQNIDLDSL